MGAALSGALSDLQAAQQSLQGLLEAVCTAPFDTSLAAFETEIFWQKAADDGNGAASVVAEFVLQWFPRRATMSLANPTTNVTSVYTPATSTGLTANATNFATLILNARNGTNGANVAVLSTTNTTPTANGGTGNWAQFTPVPLLNIIPFAGTANGATTNGIPANGILTAQITKGGNGVVVPGGTLVARVQYI